MTLVSPCVKRRSSVAFGARDPNLTWSQSERNGRAYSFAGPVLGAFFGARVTRQPTNTNAIRTATKIPNCSWSTMLILRRPEWGGFPQLSNIWGKTSCLVGRQYVPSRPGSPSSAASEYPS